MLRITPKKSLKAFEIKNENLKELEINCCSLRDEDEFVNALINYSILDSVNIKIDKRLIKWRKENGRIYYEFDA